MPKLDCIRKTEEFFPSIHLYQLLTNLVFCFFYICLIPRAIGMPQLRAADAIADETPLSVVLIDSVLVVSIPKEELVGSKVILIDGDGDVIEQITVALDPFVCKRPTEPLLFRF